MNKATKTGFILICILLTTGCWDQRLFKNAKLALSAGIDVTEEGKVLTTASVPNVEKTDQGPGKESVQTVSGIADTPWESRRKIDEKIAGSFDPSKLNVLVIGREVAEQKIYPVLDVFYRNPKSNLNAELAMATGSAADIITFKAANEPRISEYLGGLLNSAKESTIIPKQNIQLICAEIFDPGQDFMLPLLEVNQEESVVELKGLAMFHEETYSGQFLTPEESTLYMLMNAEQGKITRITEQISEGRKPRLLNFITVEVNEISRQLKVKVQDSQQITVDLKLDLTVQAIEYPKDELDSKKEINKLNQALSKNITKKAQRIVEKMQDANCDALGIGRRLIAFHHDTWEGLQWKKAYPDVQFNTKVDVNIVQHGIIN